jgi:hypothetical protein
MEENHKNYFQKNQRVTKENLTVQILFSIYLGPKGPDLQKLCVYPNNTPLIMGDRHTHFEYPMPASQDIKRTNYHLLGFN